MRLTVLGCQGGSTPARHLPGLLLDGTVLLEAGSVTSTLGLAEQLDIEHVLLSHAHLDHIGGLAYLADNRGCHRLSSGNGQTLAVSSIAPVLEDLRAHFFNERIWPDFSAIPTARDPVLRLHALRPGEPSPIGDRLPSSRSWSTTRCPRPGSSCTTVRARWSSRETPGRPTVSGRSRATWAASGRSSWRPHSRTASVRSPSCPAT